ncbi:MAG: hypothetical protein HY248_06985 [Fimbriimonas ginsengisoli]|uniref:Uncharacterized protein n=1 Tax=Fimbriimonas ginsengisoli TaxID=1005039 RepID=A0A931LVV3_FIMGI|nr:hypothetical protein [Fimbriimonas ginsengisoli]MBI3722283.1 hypothetical protein [Fimbriimonas ginsengisoli]
MSPNQIAETTRLAITPRLDGKIGADEWDPLTNPENVQTFFQWEPGKLYVAGKLPLGWDFVFSLDRNANGWLVGRDNLEARITLKEGKPKLQVRGLDSTDSQGPKWFDAADFEQASSVAAKADDKGWTFELALGDPGRGLLPTGPSQVGVRIDAVPASAAPSEAYLPRSMTTLKLAFDRHAGMPGKLIWRPLVIARSIVPGDQVKVRHTFNGNNDLHLHRLEMRSQGPLKDATTSLGMPFPEFDPKGRAFLDYTTSVEKGTDPGWFVQRSTLEGEDGVSSVLETCLRIAPPIDFDLTREQIPFSDTIRTIRMSAILQSNSSRRLDGTLTFVPPTGWRVMRGSDKAFIIPHARGRVRRTFELEVPGGVTGPFQITFRAYVGSKVIEQSTWLTVVPK